MNPPEELVGSRKAQQGIAQGYGYRGGKSLQMLEGSESARLGFLAEGGVFGNGKLSYGGIFVLCARYFTDGSIIGAAGSIGESED